MLFLPISCLLAALAIWLSWLNKSGRPVRENLFPIALLFGQATFLFWLVNLQRSIGCPTTFGECYVEHEDLLMLQMLKPIFAVTSFLFWGYLSSLSLLRIYRYIKGWKTAKNA